MPYVGPDGRAAYSVFQQKNLHRAFAISEDGGWAYSERKETPDIAIQSALSYCRGATARTCQIYAINTCAAHDSRCKLALGDFQKGERAYRNGDYITAIAEFWPLAEAGNPRAQLYVAEAYETDRGLGSNWGAAYRWYLRAAEQGQAHGWYRAGMMARYFTGEEFYDPVKGREYVTKAAELGNAEAQYRLGEWYRLGVDMEIDQEQAAKWHKMAAAQGYGPSLEVLQKHFLTS